MRFFLAALFFCFCMPRAECANQLRACCMMCNLSRLTHKKTNMPEQSVCNETGILDMMTLRSNYNHGDMLSKKMFLMGKKCNLKGRCKKKLI